MEIFREERDYEKEKKAFEDQAVRVSYTNLVTTENK